MNVTDDYRIAFLTNTYLPFVSGVSRSVDLYHRYLRKRGDYVLIYAPEYEGEAEDDHDVRRLPAIKQFNSTDFSLPLPVAFRRTMNFSAELFDVVHVHHPFLLGEVGLRMARQHRLPLVFTYHTQYENYTHYVPVDHSIARETIIRHTREFCNLCDLVIAPSCDIEKMLHDRGVDTGIEVLPSGIELADYENGRPEVARNRLGINADAPLLVYVGRIAHEKNLEYLVNACLRVLNEMPRAHLAIVGDGKNRRHIESLAKGSGVASKRVHFTGKLMGQELVDMYTAATLFVFASKSETQGMVLVEAMAAGAPVVVLDADAVSDVAKDGENGRVLPTDATEGEFAEAVLTALEDPDKLNSWREGARKTAAGFDMELFADRLHEIYRFLKCIPNHRLKDETMSFGLIRNYFETVWEDLNRWFTRI